MIYRLANGARSGLKHRLFSGLFVLMVTAGFPVLGAWLNWEDLSFGSRPVSQARADKSVLGASTAKPSDNNPPDTSSDSSSSSSAGSAAQPAAPAVERAAQTEPANTAAAKTQDTLDKATQPPPADNDDSGGDCSCQEATGIVGGTLDVLLETVGL